MFHKQVHFNALLLNATVHMLNWQTTETQIERIERDVVYLFGSAHIVVLGDGRFRMRQADFAFTLQPSASGYFYYNDRQYADYEAALHALSTDLSDFVARTKPKRLDRYARFSIGGHKSTIVGSRL